MPDKPNILFIFTDQQRADTMACYGNTMIETPNLNTLADQSFVFDNAYVSSPICTPSRSTIMTGLWPHTNGCTSNNILLDPSVPTIADMLSDEYLTGYYGKWHLGNEVIRQHGFDRWVSIEDQYREYHTDSEYHTVFSDYHQFLIDQGYESDKVSEGAMVFSRPFAAALPEEHTKSRFLADRASEFIHENRDRPFALYVNIFEPHPPYDSPFNDLYHPSSIPDSPVFLKDPPANASRMHSLRRDESQSGAGFEPGPDGPLTESFWREIRARYWGAVTLVDLAVGRILQALDEAGIANRTIVVYTSEHGDQLGDHNIIQKAVFYEQSIKVPMLVRAPWLANSSSRINGRYSHIDTVPTLLDLAGADVPDALQGISRARVLAGDESLAENDAIIDWTGRNAAANEFDAELNSVLNTPHRTLVSEDGWKLTLTTAGQCELYDLNADPWEHVNLFDSPGQASRIGAMAKRIRQWQVQAGDAAELPVV